MQLSSRMRMMLRRRPPPIHDRPGDEYSTPVNLVSGRDQVPHKVQQPAEIVHRTKKAGPPGGVGGGWDGRAELRTVRCRSIVQVECIVFYRFDQPMGFITAIVLNMVNESVGMMGQNMSKLTEATPLPRATTRYQSSRVRKSLPSGRELVPTVSSVLRTFVSIGFFPTT